MLLGMQSYFTVEPAVATAAADQPTDDAHLAHR
jgi:hypothetical protein